MQTVGFLGCAFYNFKLIFNATEYNICFKKNILDDKLKKKNCEVLIKE